MLIDHHSQWVDDYDCGQKIRITCECVYDYEYAMRNSCGQDHLFQQEFVITYL